MNNSQINFLTYMNIILANRWYTVLQGESNNFVDGSNIIVSEDNNEQNRY